MEEGEAERVEAETAEVGESRTLQGIKSLFVTGTVMKILWLVEPMGSREGGAREWLDSPTPGGIFGIPINRLIRSPMRAPNCLGTERPSAFQLSSSLRWTPSPREPCHQRRGR